VITNDVSDSYQQIYVIAHIICNHFVFGWVIFHIPHS